ncbi:efflux RND transporter periplasmic adaptor subunit [Nodosilinea sp. LEGE 07088]|uniref:efflux RND transporter periplasmic adaptor subunit n=1 Tax=Nodosilinea sp. LEGE 07088 TaxID=2777968 RepID=UPI0018824AB5|nr:efflux RND transporter periplasmic adaptor subunit [Nodosilinea sp. LEGE 07088]MBE9138615.1 efflux RND transporter periplasmic adaptor subunit [Nodosilinea sp. LEGE 07088]
MSTQPIQPWRRPGVWLLVAALVVVGAGSTVVLRNVLQTRQEAREQAELPPPRQVKVVALGRVEPASQVIDVATAEAGRIERLMVKEGDQVDQGQVLAYLDTYDVRQAERDYAASQLKDARAQFEAETALGSSQVQEANTRVSQIDRPQQAAIAAQDAAIASLQAELNVAEIDLTRFQELNASGAISRQELDRQQATVDRLKADLTNAQATKQQLEQSRLNDMKNAQAQVASARATTTRAQVESRVDSAVQNLALAEAQLARTIIRAPQAGQVLDIFAYPGESVSPGEGPVLALGNTNQMIVVAEVSETNIGLVEVGQPVTITSRNGAFSETLTGTVDELGLQIAKNDVLDDDPAANADARVVEVRVKVDQSDVVAALTNLQVDVAIDVDS